MRYGFTQYVSPSGSPEESADPIADLRAGWDRHVEFRLAHPSFYALLYGDVQPGKPCAVTAPAMEMLTRLLKRAAGHRLLSVPPADAAAQIYAANVGVTLSLITQPEGERDVGLAERVREAAISAVLAAPRGGRGTAARPTSRRAAAITLAAALDRDPDGLTPGELAILRELLTRLGGSRAGRFARLGFRSRGRRRPPRRCRRSPPSPCWPTTGCSLLTTSHRG
ncbi:hypothetical protein GCM10022251_77150 [Phytohabitans flavus]|uniref:Uncharacterized protein n=1 Tax=Phytohabitans flavus TaxID=1076124 RepID=A0A6F8XLQ1_9ACTN|nr:TetR/AcrR family transcriptional regulator [Phytohabitans flavus]BCB74711.1 hypothetical protein Pflav_011210 [Phytohabitans flavus]